MYTVIMSIILSLFSTAVMSYISMATPIGPWIAPTLVLFAGIISKCFCMTLGSRSLALMVASGSIGGIIATACGFSFPTLYFLDPLLFAHWVDRPVYFSFMLSGLVACAGWFGLWVANILEKKLLVQEHLSFPIGQLIYKMIAAGDSIKRSYELAIGFCSAVIIGLAQEAWFGFAALIPRLIQIIPKMRVGIFAIPAIGFDMSIVPMVIAIGFVTGHVIAVPLLVGALARLLFLDPLNYLLFSSLSNIEFLLAFCSGMVISGASVGLLSLPQQIYTFLCKMKNARWWIEKKDFSFKEYALEFFFLFIICLSFFSYIGLSFAAQLYLLITTYACINVMAIIAGKIGLAQLGRFATFVMVPSLFIFSLNHVQIVFIATFVEIAGGVAVDVLFGRKVAQLLHIRSYDVKKYQYLGLLISTISIGFIFWLLVSHFQLGSSQLCAYKAQARQLLIHAHHFNYLVLFCGFLSGYILKYCRVNAGLALGGILMPFNISLGLIVGGYIALISSDKERWYPLWSGVFAGNSLWMLLTALIK